VSKKGSVRLDAAFFLNVFLKRFPKRFSKPRSYLDPNVYPIEAPSRNTFPEWKSLWITR